jgi:hypothetical protein
MKLAPGVKLFIGLKVDQKLREQLESANEMDKKYIGDPQFLMYAEGEAGAQYIGRLLTEAVSTDEIEDIARNVVSILKRVAPSVRSRPASRSSTPSTPTPSRATSTTRCA